MGFKDSAHDSAVGHVTGQSVFIADRAEQKGELWVEVLYSTQAHAKIKCLNFEAARKIEGVSGIFTYHDLAHNRWGSIVQDQPLLAEKKVHYFGEPIAVIAARDQAIAIKAKNAIIVDYEPLEAVLTLKQAKKQQFYMGETYRIACGNAPTALESAKHTLSGEFISAGQEQFYLESQASIVYPDENDCLVVHCSAQHPTEVQHVVAKALGLQQQQVVCVVKRMGGGFGGKESQSAHYAALAALVAAKTGRPARLCLTKDDDMKATGKRHPFRNDYQVGFDDEGRIEALSVHFYADGGAYIDLTPAIIQRAMFHVDNAYFLKNAELNGTICKTHTHPHTAFRGFGGPQGAAVIESIIEDIAHYLGKDSLEIRKLNCYQGNRNTTPYDQVVENNVLPELFDQLEADCDYQQRRSEIKTFNRASGSLLKGLALTAVKFGISFTTRFLNQGNALVNVHADGSVQVSTGATEMGQGVNTKIRRVVSEKLGVDENSIRMMVTSTEKNANTSATAASSGSDINAAAAQIASRNIKQRLANIAVQIWDGFVADDNHELSIDDTINIESVMFEKGQVFDMLDSKRRIKFTELVKIAYLNRISLCDYGHYRTPEIHYDRAKGKGRPFLYYTNGVAASEVSVDRFTGEVKILRSDLLMDLGRLINDGIDHGQTTGAFIQGAGWVTTENLYYNDAGELLSCSPTTYKIPNIQDTPRVFNLNFIENNSNLMNIRGSKAVGEPPLVLGLSVWAAVKDALFSAGTGAAVNLKLPATNEQVLTSLTQLKKH